MSLHRFVVMVEVDEGKRLNDGRLDVPDTWDHQDLTEAIEAGTAVIVEVDGEEEFEQ